MDQTIENGKDGGFSVYEFGEYPESSVLAGQTCKRFVDNFDSVEEAQASYPSAELGYRDAHNHFDHLPDESDYWSRKSLWVNDLQGGGRTRRVTPWYTTTYKSSVSIQSHLIFLFDLYSYLPLLRFHPIPTLFVLFVIITAILLFAQKSRHPRRDDD